jgi:NAD(P)-dependent dehydrogenase (short-subunit alcohol dehydrogenase family)
MTNSRLRNKAALVTGATSNIGRAIAAGFAAEGAHVVATGRSPERGAELIEEIKANGGRAEFVPMDLDGTPRACGALAAEAARLLGGGIDILVNNAGVVHEPLPQEVGPHSGDAMMNGTPAGTHGTPDAIAHAAVYLASDEAAFVHGTVIDVDGGRTGVAVIAA